MFEAEKARSPRVVVRNAGGGLLHIEEFHPDTDPVHNTRWLTGKGVPNHS